MYHEESSETKKREYSIRHALCIPSRRTLLVMATAAATAAVVVILLLAIFAYAYRDILYARGVETAQTPSLVEQQTLVRTTEPAVDVVARASDAVVSVVITKDIPIVERYYEHVDPFGEWGLFGGGFEVPRERQLGTEPYEVGGGTGFFVSNDGLLVTNRHVVEDQDARYSIVTNRGKSYEAEVLVRDTQLDIAILRVTDIPTDEYSHLAFGDSKALLPGQTVIAIGNALTEFRNSVSVGVVSGLSRSITAGDRYGGRAERLDGVIQTDAAINPGNSGGPLLNMWGEVVGVNVAIAGGAENIGFAIPADAVERAVTSVQEHGEIRRPYVGVRYIELTEAIAAKNDLSISYGAWLKGGVDGLAVSKDSPAARAGLIENDIITSFDGVSLQGRSLAALVQTQAVGAKVTVEYVRGGETRSVEIVLEQMPNEIVE